MTVQAHAKVNLSLRVVGRRPDGFHEIETLMVPLSLCDDLEITISPGTGIEFFCDDPALPAGPENLIWKAVEAFERLTGRTGKLTIRLSKRIPHGAGLGGGSSDAAATLKVLDTLHGTALGREALQELAAGLGSDVPFFLQDGPAVCRGRGERVESLSAIESARILLLKPQFPVPTPWAYQNWALNDRRPDPIQRLGDLDLFNDLEAPVFGKYLLLPVLKQWLLAQQGVRAAMMSGSGSTLWAILEDECKDLAPEVRAEFGSEVWVHEDRI